MHSNTDTIQSKKEYKIKISNVVLGPLFLSAVTLLYIFMYRGNIDSVRFLILLNAITMLVPIFFVKDIFHPFIILALSTGLTLINFLDYKNNGYFLRYASDFTNSYSSFAASYSLILIFTWQVCLFLGYLFTNSRYYPFKNKILNKSSIKNRRKIAFFLIVFSIIGFLGVIFSFDGLQNMLQAMVSTTQTYSGKSYYRNIVSLGGIAALLLLNEKRIKTSLLVLFLTMIMLSFFGGRGAIILGTLLPYLMLYHYNEKKFNLRKLFPFIVTAIAFVLVWEQMRRFGEINFENLEFDALLIRVASNTRMADILPALVGKLLNGSIPLQYGKPFINILFAPIPRSMWVNKPLIIDESVLIGSYLLTGEELYGLPAGPYGWAYFNFGFLGVIFSGFIIGAIVKKTYMNSIDSPVNKDTVIIYVLIIRLLFDIFSTSAQINILWYVGIFILIKIVDRFQYQKK